jgi:hypothetical protein
MSLLVNQCQKAQNNISALHAMGLYWIPGCAKVRGNEIADGLTRCGSASRFVGPEPALGASRQDLRNRINHWLFNQHWGQWLNLGNTQRQARELISGPCLGTKHRLLSFNRIQSRAVTGFITSHNTLRRHPHLMGLTDSPLCRKCEAEDETCAYILCRCEALASLRHAYLGSFILEPEYIKNVSLRPSGTLAKRQGSHKL